MPGLPTYEFGSSGIPTSARGLGGAAAATAIDTSLVSFSKALIGLGDRLAGEQEQIDLADAKQQAAAVTVFRPDGSLAPLDLRQPYTAVDRTYNQFATAAYTARIENDAANQASQIRVKHTLDPDGFAKEYGTWAATTLKQLPGGLQGLMGPRLSDIGVKSKLGLDEAVSKEQQREALEATQTLVTRKSNEVAAFIKNGGDPSSPEAIGRLSEIEAAIKGAVAAKTINQAVADRQLYETRDQIAIAHIGYQADQVRRTKGLSAALDFVHASVKNAGDTLYGDRDKLESEALAVVNKGDSEQKRKQTESYDRLTLQFEQQVANEDVTIDHDAIDKMPIGAAQKAAFHVRLEHRLKVQQQDADREEKEATEKAQRELRYQLIKIEQDPKASAANLIPIEQAILRNKEEWGDQGLALYKEVLARRNAFAATLKEHEAASKAVDAGAADQANIDGWKKVKPQITLRHGDVDQVRAAFEQRPRLSTEDVETINGAARGNVSNGAVFEKSLRFVQQTYNSGETQRAAMLEQLDAGDVAVLLKAGRLLDDGRAGGKQLGPSEALDVARRAINEEKARAGAPPTVADAKVDYTLRESFFRNQYGSRWNPAAFLKAMANGEAPPVPQEMIQSWREARTLIQASGAGAAMKDQDLDNAASGLVMREGWGPSTLTDKGEKRWVRQAPETVTRGLPSGMALLQLQAAQALYDGAGRSPEQAHKDIEKGRAWLVPAPGRDGKTPAWNVLHRDEETGIVGYVRGSGLNNRAEVKFDRSAALDFEKRVAAAAPNLGFELPYALGEGADPGEVGTLKVPDFARIVTEPLTRAYLEGKLRPQPPTPRRKPFEQPANASLGSE